MSLWDRLCWCRVRMQNWRDSTGNGCVTSGWAKLGKRAKLAWRYLHAFLALDTLPLHSHDLVGCLGCASTPHRLCLGYLKCWLLWSFSNLLLLPKYSYVNRSSEYSLKGCLYTWRYYHAHVTKISLCLPERCHILHTCEFGGGFKGVCIITD